MGAFGGMILTNKGKALQAKAQTGVQIKYTRIAAGDGSLSGQSIVDMNALINEKKSMSIAKLKIQPGGKAVVGSVLSNQELSTGFYLRELGVFAQDPDAGEILYCYGNAGTNADYISSSGGPDIVEKTIDVITIVGNARSRTADPAQAPTGVSGTITQWFSWITNRIKAITGKTNWFDAPDTTLAAANTHMNDTVKHITSAERMTWNGKLDASANLPANQATQDSTHRFATDTEKSNWNGKLDVSTYNNQVNQDVRTTASPSFAGLNLAGTSLARTRLNGTQLEYWNGTTWVSMSAVKSVQRGITASTANVTIAAVDMNKTMVNLLSNTNLETGNTNATTVTLRLTHQQI